MGWWGGFSSMKEVRDEVLREMPECRILGHSSTKFGQNLWVAYHTERGGAFIGLYMIRGNGKSYRYKSLEEADGPTETDCPQKILDLVPERDVGYAKAWRERVKAAKDAKRGLS